MATPTDKKISDLTPITTIATGDIFPVYDVSDTTKTKNITYSEILSNTDTMTNKTIGFTAGTATAGTAPIKLTSGTVNTTPEAGTIEFDGTYFYITI